MYLSTAWTIFQKGGIVMYPLIICSIIVVAIAVERFLYYRNSRVNVELLLSEIKPVLAQGKFGEAAKVCEEKNRLVADVLAQSLNKSKNDVHRLENTLEGCAAFAAAKLRERLNYLDTIVTMSPLLGLLGTVVGMIQTFSIMNVKTGNPTAITGGIGEALIATATGLCVAILALIVHTYFAHQLDLIVSDIEQAGTELVNEVNWGDAV